MSSEQTVDWTPMLLAVAPNGARKTHADHPAVPISPAEIAATAAAAVEAGAAMIHLHVRDAAQKHSLDVGAYREATAAVREAVGARMVIQVTSEAVGIYSAEQQMAMVRELEPEAVSLAIRELVPEGGEDAAREFLTWLVGTGILPQYILYAPEDVERFARLQAAGVVPPGPAFLLFVLGRYTPGQRSVPNDLLPYLTAIEALGRAGPRQCRAGRRRGGRGAGDRPTAGRRRRRAPHDGGRELARQFDTAQFDGIPLP